MSRWKALFGLLVFLTPHQALEGQAGWPFGGCPEPTSGTGVILGMVREAATQAPGAEPVRRPARD